jgi:UDP-3-O-[3-hydroxymyristoyl] N-acetylglucosamine deacetylase
LRRIEQQTLKNRISCTGVGLHSGVKVNMTLVPAAPDTGVVFYRTDLSGEAAVVPARWDTVTDVTLCTTIGNAPGARVGTVEHLMAALAGCEIDNVRVELDAPEVPIMDGSAAPFVFLVECAGTIAQDRPRRWIKVTKPIDVHDGSRAASLAPADRFSVSFSIAFDNPLVGRQTCLFDLRNGTFKTEVARARTFGFIEEVDKLRAVGLARGGSLDNAVVISGDRILNEGGLRFADEFVRHKVLDLVGDLHLVGAPMIGHFHGERSGHSLNNRLISRLMRDRSAWHYSDEPSQSLDAIHRINGLPAAATA